VAQDLCSGFARLGHSVSIVTAFFKGLPANEIVDGVSIFRVRSLRSLPYRASAITMAAYVFKGWIKARQLILQQRPDLVHVHFAVPAGWIAYLLWREFRIPYVITTHLGDVPGGVPGKTNRWFRWVFPLTPPVWKNAARVVAVSEFTRNLVLKKYLVNVDVIHNGIQLQDTPLENVRVGNPPKIVFAGRFTPQKDPVQIIRSLANLKDLSWRCILVGDGPLKDEIKKSIQTNHLSDRIQFTGWINPDEVEDLFANSDVLFMPSLSEGLPVVGLQALAAGLAFLVSDIGGFIDLVEEGKNGYKLPPGDHPGWAEKLRELLENPNSIIDLKRNSLVKAKKFEINHIVELYNDAFQQVIYQSGIK